MLSDIRNNLAQLATNPPVTLFEGLGRLQDLFDTLHNSIDERLACAKTDYPDYQAILAEVAVYVEALEVVRAAMSDLKKALASADAALARVFKKFYAPRVDARVWTKLRTPTSDNPISTATTA
jgi:hypothetical protein